jgi:hypothetical protein
MAGLLLDFCVVDLIAVLAGGTYIRCFNAISGSLHWETSIPMADANSRAVVEVFGTGKDFDFYLK